MLESPLAPGVVSDPEFDVLSPSVAVSMEEKKLVTDRFFSFSETAACKEL